MYPTTDIHSLDTWLALFDRDAERAAAYGDALASRIENLGIMADPALITSFVAYQQAQQQWDEAAPRRTAAPATDPAFTARTQHPPLFVYTDCLQWLKLIQDAPLDALTFLMPETPTTNEWLVLIHHDAAQAEQQIIRLQAEVAGDDDFLQKPDIDTVEEFGQARRFHVGAAHVMSIRGYQTAQQAIANPPDHSTSDTRLAQRLRLGRATLTAYPEHTEWPELFSAEPAFTRALQHELELKAATFGIEASCVLNLSIADARKLIPPAPSQPLSAEMRELSERIRQDVHAAIEIAEKVREMLRPE